MTRGSTQAVAKRAYDDMIDVNVLELMFGLLLF